MKNQTKPTPVKIRSLIQARIIVSDLGFTTIIIDGKYNYFDSLHIALVWLGVIATRR